MPRFKIPDEILDRLVEFGPEGLELFEEQMPADVAMPRRRKRKDKAKNGEGNGQKRPNGLLRNGIVPLGPADMTREISAQGRDSPLVQQPAGGDSAADETVSAEPAPADSAPPALDPPSAVDPSLPPGQRGPVDSLFLLEEIKRK